MSEYPLAIKIRGHARKRVTAGNRTDLPKSFIKQMFAEEKGVFCYSDGASEHWIIYDESRGQFLAVILETESNMRLRGGTSRKVITVHLDHNSRSEQRALAKQLALEREAA